jgi:hypothetical protein
MKNFLLLSAIMAGLGLSPALAQFGAHAGAEGPHLGGAMNKLFGDQQAFSASLEINTATTNESGITMPGKFSHSGSKDRFEINMGDVKGSRMSASLLQQMKAMGMDVVITISRPDLQRSYLVYPGLTSYAESLDQKTTDSTNLDDYKMQVTELGKESLDGHDCVKKKVIVTDKNPGQHEFIVWNATDLKNFPVKIEATEVGQSAHMHFKDVSFDPPAASLFDPPSGFTKYNDLTTMMQTELLKKMGGGAGQPPAGH